MLSMQTAVMAKELSVRLSVRHVPVFFQMNEDTMVRSSTSGGIIILVSDEEVKFIRIFAKDQPPARALK